MPRFCYIEGFMPQKLYTVSICDFTTRNLEIKFAFDVLDCVFYAHADLFHRVAVAYGNGAVLEGVEVDGYAERRTDFVLTAVTLTD